jgi:hypothetical protein
LAAAELDGVGERAAQFLRRHVNLPSFVCPSSTKNGARRKTIFANRFNPITLVKPVGEKYSCFVFSENVVLYAHPASQEGRTRRHERGGGLRWT